MLHIPGVVLYFISYSFLKGSVYGFMFWLPLYIDKTEFKNQAGLIVSMLDIGTLCGSLITGFISDKIRAYSKVISPQLLISAAYLFSIKYILNLN